MSAPSDLVLERYLAGTLDPARRAAVEAAAASDPAVRARLDALAASDREILTRYPPEAVARRVRVARGLRPGRSAAGVALVVALAAAVVLMLRPPAGSERVKGGPALVVYREGQRAPLRDGDPVRAGDVLQLAFVRGDAAHGAIVAIDGRGAVTLHAEELPDSAPGHTTLLDSALMLDDAPGFERFFLVTCPGPVPLDPLVEGARGLGRDPAAAREQPLPIRSDCRQTSRLLIKEPTP